ncbi:hypothetical protein BST61_g938 [Cercospora zeina]
MLTYIAFLLLHHAHAHPASTPNISSACLSPDSDVVDYQAFPDQNAAETGNLFPTSLCNGQQIEEASIDQIQGYFEQGLLTSQQLTFCYMQRIWQTDDYLNAALEINPDSMQIALALDHERTAGHVRGPLHGIPFMVKDNIATKDQMQTTAGSWALQGSIVPRDAHVVRKLREAGAVLLGKATLSEWASTRGFPNESEYTYIKVDFYRDLQNYLAELNNTDMRSLEDIVAYNYLNDGSEGGNPWPLGNPAFYSGQDGILASLETKGIQDELYFQALNFCRSSTRERGIDHALSLGPNDTTLDALLVPPDVGQSYQIAAQAGYPVITIPAGVNSESGMPFGFALMQTAWREDALVKWASAIEDLMKDAPCKRTLPRWYGYLERNVPVVNA